ncbi:MAG: 2'-5' RNA ligase family protein [Rudaea sp.]
MSLIEGPAREETLRLWAWLEKKYGASKAQLYPHPHITYYYGLLGNADVWEIERGLERISSVFRPLEVFIDGVDVFSSEVIYLAVRRTPELDRLQMLIGDLVEKCGAEPVRNYRPGNWVPHVTLAVEDLKPPAFSAALRELSEQRISLRSAVSSLKFYQDSGPEGSSTQKDWPLGPREEPGANGQPLARG